MSDQRSGVSRHVQEVVGAVPRRWKFHWNINPGTNWDINREEGAFGFAVVQGVVYIACGLDWDWHSEWWNHDWYVEAVRVDRETLDAMRSWCADSQSPFPPIPGIQENHQPRLDKDSAAKLLRALDEVEVLRRT